jgi:uncharacterized protein YdhG (YjbR/CyaY superfamily)
MAVVDDYLAGVASPQKEALQHIQAIIGAEVPEAEQVITYGMPGFKYKKKYLIAFAAFKDHMSLFPGAAPLPELEAKLADYRTSKGTLQFTAEKPIPDDLVREVAYACKARIDDRG